VTVSLPSKLWRCQLSLDGKWWAVTSSQYSWYISLQITTSSCESDFFLRTVG